MKTKSTLKRAIIFVRIFAFVSLVAAFLGSCNSSKVTITQPELKGKWAGTAKFFGVDFNQEMGLLPFELELAANDKVSGKIGEAHFSSGEIKKADFGYEIQVELDQKVKASHACNKQKLSILLVMPVQTKDSSMVLDADIHLKSSFFFDLSMQAGNVQLKKVE